MFGFMTRRPTQRADRRPLFHPRLEPLEDRAVPSVTFLSGSTNLASVTQQVTFTATVQESGSDNVRPGTGTPAGTVIFYNGLTLTPLAIETVTPTKVPGQGTAVFTTTGLAAGSYAVFAAYSGESIPGVIGSFTAGSDSISLGLTVTPTATGGQLIRVKGDGFVTAYSLATGNIPLALVSAFDYLASLQTVSDGVQQEFSQAYGQAFELTALLLITG
jgi:hypothetical protein